MVGFTMELCTIYQQAFPSVDASQSSDWSPVASPIDMFENLFFCLFGLVQPDNLPSMERNPVWANTLVKIVFGTYLVITFIVLLNLLIAMMEHTYDRIQEESDLEWKFGRAKLFRNMKKTSPTPTPLNMFAKLFVYLKVLIKHGGIINCIFFY